MPGLCTWPASISVAMTKAGNKPGWLALNAGASNWLWGSLLVIVLDQLSKQAILDRFAEFDELVVLPVLDIVRWHNEGAAWSILSDAEGWQRWFFVALGVGVSIGILVWLRQLPAKGQARVAAGLALVMGGALGNVIDRVRLGYVVDFIKVHYGDWTFPAFNIADSAITVGAALLILDSVIEYGRKTESRS